MQTDEVFISTEEDRLLILKQLNRNLNSAKCDVESIKNWMKKISILRDKNTLTDRRIENFLVFNKFNVEKTKKKLKFYYQARKNFPELFLCKKGNRYLLLGLDCVALFPLPKLFNLHRILIFELFDHNPDSYDFDSAMVNLIRTCDLILQTDKILGAIAIIDVKGYTPKHTAKINFSTIKKMIYMLEKSFSGRIHSLHFFNMSPLMESLIKLCKRFIPEKFMEKIQVHSTQESLVNYFSKEHLPVDLGGVGKQMKEQKDVWKKFVEGHGWLFDQLEAETKATVFSDDNETKDFDWTIGEEVGGNFRQLDFD